MNAILQAVEVERQQRLDAITTLQAELEQLDLIQTAAEGLGPAPAPEPAAPKAAAGSATGSVGAAAKPPVTPKRPARRPDPAGGRGAKGAERRQAVLDTLKAATEPLGAKDIQTRCGIPAGSWHDVIRGLITDKLVIADGATSNRTYRLAGVKPPPGGGNAAHRPRDAHPRRHGHHRAGPRPHVGPDRVQARHRARGRRGRRHHPLRPRLDHQRCRYLDQGRGG